MQLVTKLKPMFIYHSSNPRALKNDSKLTLQTLFLLMETQRLDDSTSLQHGLLNILSLLKMLRPIALKKKKNHFHCMMGEWYQEEKIMATIWKKNYHKDYSLYST